MAKHALKILRSEHRKMFKVCFGHFSTLWMKGVKALDVYRKEPIRTRFSFRKILVKQESKLEQLESTGTNLNQYENLKCFIAVS